MHLKINCSKKKIKDVLDYIIIILLFYYTGGAFSSRNYSLKITMLLIAMLILVLFFAQKRNEKRLYKGVCLLTAMIFFILLVPVLNSDSNLGPYIAIPMQLCIGLLVAIFIEKKVFEEKFIYIITVFAAISLLGFVLQIMVPSIALAFPMSTVEDASVNYYNAIVYVFMSPKGFYDNSVMTVRNAGICWEPGCYQAFLNLGIFFLLAGSAKEKIKNRAIILFILIITVITTFSTNGYIIMGILLLVYHKNVKAIYKTNKKIFILGIGGSIIALCLIQAIGIDIFRVFDKVQKEFNSSSENNVIERVSLEKIKYLFYEGHFYFFGMSFSRWTTINESMWNSIIHTILCIGIPFTTLQLYGYWKFSAKYKYPLVIFIILIMCFSTETLFWRTFFNSLIFMGILYKKKE